MVELSQVSQHSSQSSIVGSCANQAHAEYCISMAGADHNYHTQVVLVMETVSPGNGGVTVMRELVQCV